MADPKITSQNNILDDMNKSNEVDILASRFAGLRWPGFNSGYISTLPAPVKRRLKALKKIQLESSKIEAKFYEEVHKLECKYQGMYQPLHEKRSKITRGEHEPNDDECQWSIDDEPKIIEFGNGRGIILHPKAIIFPACPEKKKEVEAILLDIMGIKKEAANKEVLFNDLKTKLVDEKNKKEAEDKVVKGVPEFWLTVFKNAFKNTRNTSLQEADDPILTKLKDITITFHESPMGFTLHFDFEPNDYFSNGVLTKEYEMKCEPSEDDPLSFEGPEIFNCKGTMINWKEPFLRREVKKGSFFDFFEEVDILARRFAGPDPEADVDAITQDLLLADFAIGEYIRDMIIPKAVLFFTGEIPQEDLDPTRPEFNTSNEEEEEEDEDEEDSPIIYYSSSE